MRECPDPANGDAYDPSYRVSIADYEPKHNPHRNCKPYYHADDNPDDYNGPADFWHHYTIHDPDHVNISADYVSNLHPYLYGLPRRGL